MRRRVTDIGMAAAAGSQRNTVRGRQHARADICHRLALCDRRGHMVVIEGVEKLPGVLEPGVPRPQQRTAHALAEAGPVHLGLDAGRSRGGREEVSSLVRDRLPARRAWNRESRAMVTISSGGSRKAGERPFGADMFTLTRGDCPLQRGTALREPAGQGGSCRRSGVRGAGSVRRGQQWPGRRRSGPPSCVGWSRRRYVPAPAPVPGRSTRNAPTSR